VRRSATELSEKVNAGTNKLNKVARNRGGAVDTYTQKKKTTSHTKREIENTTEIKTSNSSEEKSKVGRERFSGQALGKSAARSSRNSKSFKKKKNNKGGG